MRNVARSLIGYRAKAGTCEACSLRAQCTTSKTGRQVLRHFDEEYVDRVKGYRGTFLYEKALRKRRVWVEPLFAEAKDWHGMRRFRLRRLEKVNIEALLIASGQNVKRLLTFGERRPKNPAQAAVLRPPVAMGHEISRAREHRWSRSWWPTKAFFNGLASLVAERTRTFNRLHGLLRDLVPGGVPGTLSARRAAYILRGIRPQGSSSRVRRRLASEILRDIRTLDRKIANLNESIEAELEASGTTLTKIFGIAPILAAKIMGTVGSVVRFPTKAHFASYSGTAPVEASSGGW